MERNYDLPLILCESAMEIDMYIRGKYIDKNKNLPSVEKFTKILGECLFHDKEDMTNFELIGSTELILHGFAYAMEITSDKNMKKVSELGLEAKLFHSELSNIKNLSKEKLIDLRDFLSKLYSNLFLWRDYVNSLSWGISIPTFKRKLA